MEPTQVNTRVSNYFVLFLLFHGLYALTPALRLMHIAILIDFSFVLCVAFILITRKRILNKNYIIREVFKVIFLITSITTLYKIIGYSTASFGSCVSYFSLFMSIIFGWYISVFASHKQKIFVLVCYTAIILLNVIVNIYLIQVVFEGVDIEKLQESASLEGVANYGGSSFAAYAFFASLCFLILTYYSRNFYHTIISFVPFCVCIYYVIFCSMRGTTAVLFIAAFILLTTNRYLQNSKISPRNINTFIFFFCFILFIFKDSLFQLLIDYAPNERLAVRFEDVMSTSSNGVSEESFTGRGALFKIAFNSWLQNPITFLFGIGEPLLGSDDNKYLVAGISGHSDMVDQLAKYGLLGSILFLRCLYLGYKYLRRMYVSTKCENLVKYVILCFFIYGTIKIMYHDDCFIVVFILFPLVLDIVRRNTEIQSNT